MKNKTLMNNYLEGVKAKLTVTPFLSEAKPNDQTTLMVPFGSTIATTSPVTAHTFVTTASVTLCLKEPPPLKKNMVVKKC